MSNEMKQAHVETLKNAEAVYVLMSACTSMPFVVCDPETYDDEIYIFLGEEDAKKEGQRLVAQENPLRVVKIEKKFFTAFYGSLIPMGVNAIVTDKGTEREFSMQLSDLVTRQGNGTDAQGNPIVENPELQLTALYLMQKLRAHQGKEVVWTDELRELQEEMMAHYAKGRYIVAYQEEKGLPVLKNKDGMTLQPIFTDMQEFLKFQNMQKDVPYKTAVLEAGNIAKVLAKDAVGISVNPYTINLVLQLRQENKTEE